MHNSTGGLLHRYSRVTNSHRLGNGIADRFALRYEYGYPIGDAFRLAHPQWNDDTDRFAHAKEKITMILYMPKTCKIEVIKA